MRNPCIFAITGYISACYPGPGFHISNLIACMMVAATKKVDCIGATATEIVNAGT